MQPYSRLSLVAVLAYGLAPNTALAQPDRTFVPVTDAVLQAPSDDDWLMWRRTLDGSSV